jgi:hypothetical protein
VSSVLEPWCAAGATGALHVLDPPGGTVYLMDGQLTYAECPLATGVAGLLLTPGTDLAAAAVSALFGAALFLLDASATAQFEPGVVHPVGMVCLLDLRTVCVEVRRRRRLLDDTWPDTSLDTATFGPGPTRADDRLTDLEGQLMAHADHRYSPVDLARMLGRDTFAMLLAARGLARAGMITMDSPTGRTAAGPHPNPTRTAGRTAAWAPQRLSGPGDELPRRDPDGWVPPPPRRRTHDRPLSGADYPAGTLLRIRQALEELP